MATRQLTPVSFSDQTITASQPVESNCSGITFFNDGTDNFVVRGKTVLPGSFINFGVDLGEIDQTNYIVSFANAAGTIQKCVIIRKTMNVPWVI